MSDPINDPEIQAILSAAQARDREWVRVLDQQANDEARFHRAYFAWARVSNFRNLGIPDELAGEALCHGYAALIVELGRVLREDGWAECVDAVDPGSGAKKYALRILRSAIEGNAEGVAALLGVGVKTAFGLGMGANGWLQEGLMYEVLGIERPPDPPLGWEGNYPFEVQTLDDFVRWVDLELLIYEGSNLPLRETNGSLVRNAYRLLDLLDINDVLPQPIGNLSRSDETAILRNLRRDVNARPQQSADIREVQPIGPGASELILTDTQRVVLEILRQQPPGRGLGGKGIISALRTREIEIEKSTLYRHVMPELLRCHGVSNERSRGGYFIAAPLPET